jgi:O-antigen/teichoic acid export membrane protein
MGSQIASLLASFPMSVLIARTLGPSGKGTLSLVQMIASFAAITLNFGIGQAFTYYAARREARGRDAVVLSYAMGASVSVLLALLAIPFGPYLARALQVSELSFVVIGLVLTGPVLIAQYLNAYVFGSGAIRNASAVNVGSLYFQLAAVAVLWVLGLLTPASAIAVWATASTGVALVFTAMAWRGQATADVPLGAFRLLKRMWAYGLAAWPGGILGTAAQRFDVFLLAFFKSPSEVGIYAIAVTLAELCWYVPNALSSVLLPKIAHGGEDQLEITLRMGRVTWLATALSGIAVLAVSAPLVPLVFGKAFSSSILPLACILPGIVAGSMSSSAGAYLAGTGRPINVTIAAGVNVAVNVTANIILIPRLGATGAALSSAISYFVAAAMTVGFFTKYSGASPKDLLVPRKADIVALADAMRRALRREG